MQLLSEPSGGSDVAGALTTAVRDGDEWILNGSKVWTTGAWWSDWGLCLARTNWDVPKHRGLTVFMFPLHQDGVEVQQIEMLNGSKEFCQEFLTDVRVPDADRIGEVDDGWTVGTRWMFHERMLHNSPLVTVPVGHAPRARRLRHRWLDVARDAVALDDPDGPRPRRRGPHARCRRESSCSTGSNQGIATGAMSDQVGGRRPAVQRRCGDARWSPSRSRSRAVSARRGPTRTAVPAHAGIDFLIAADACIGGGTTEMARNVISERVLGHAARAERRPRRRLPRRAAQQPRSQLRAITGRSRAARRRPRSAR